MYPCQSAAGRCGDWVGSGQSLPESVTMGGAVRTDVVGQEVGREALGSIAERRVVMCIPSKQQHGPAE